VHAFRLRPPSQRIRRTVAVPNRSDFFPQYLLPYPPLTHPINHYHNPRPNQPSARGAATSSAGRCAEGRSRANPETRPQSASWRRAGPSAHFQTPSNEASDVRAHSAAAFGRRAPAALPKGAARQLQFRQPPEIIATGSCAARRSRAPRPSIWVKLNFTRAKSAHTPRGTGTGPLCFREPCPDGNQTSVLKET